MYVQRTSTQGPTEKEKDKFKISEWLILKE